jgi:hypothetical protein
MEAEARLREPGLALPTAPQPVGAYLLAMRVGDLLYLSGTTCYEDGELLCRGRVGGRHSRCKRAMPLPNRQLLVFSA